MTDFKKESRTINKQNWSEHINSASDHQKPILGTSSQRKVSSKIETTITRQQLMAAKWLFDQYGIKPPTWLRQKFNINQRRRKTLNVQLLDAQLDRAYCGHNQNDLGWDGLLHQLWHQINGVPTCK